MAAALNKNNAYSTMAGALTNVSSSMTVATGHGDRFPEVTGSDWAMVTLQDASNNIEIVKVTARASGADAMNITRAQEGTTARAWSIGDIVELRLTAGTVATVNGTQTLTNKTISGSDNTLTNIPGANVTGTVPLAASAAACSGNAATATTAAACSGNAATATNATTAATVSTTVASGAVGTTQAVDDNTTKIATTEFVIAQAAAATPLAAAASAAVGTATRFARADHVHPTAEIGVGQTWQSVTGSRALGTHYTNSTGRPITAHVTATSTAVCSMGITVDGVQTIGTAYAGVGQPVSHTMVVPAGATYTAQVTGGTGTLTAWAELKA